MASSAHVTKEIYTCLGELTLHGLWFTCSTCIFAVDVNCTSSKYFRVLKAHLNVWVQSRSIRIWKCWFWRRRENQSTWGKTLQSKRENQQQTPQTIYDIDAQDFEPWPHWWVESVLTTAPPFAHQCYAIFSFLVQSFSWFLCKMGKIKPKESKNQPL